MEYRVVRLFKGEIGHPSGEKGFDKSDINYFRFFLANISSDKAIIFYVSTI